MNQYSGKASEFKPDGSLRDIYVLDVTEEIWEAFIRYVRKSHFQLEFWHG